VGSDFTLTAASAIEAVAAAASSATPLSPRDFRIIRNDLLIMDPFVR
jgi:hypothetical protein